MAESTPHDNNSPPRLWAHAPVWASLMAADSGAACPWWWDTIDPENGYFIFRSASDFVRASALADQNSLTKSVPRIAGGASGALAFAPSGGWATATQDTFTVGNAAPDGIASAPSFLQGNYHRAMTPNGYTFLVNYSQAGTFSVQVRTIALSGAGLQILIDNVIRTNITFPSSSADVSTNFVASFAVAAGAHTIKLWNPGTDWIVLGDITLNPYASALSAFAIGNPSFNATWIWNRASLFNVNASSSLSGTVDVVGLNPGSYFGTWWDAYQGGVLSNFTFTVADALTPITLTTPSFLRSIAFFASLHTNGPAGNNGPTITREPADQTIALGQNATFTVAGVGTAPITCQWLKNGNPIPGAIASSFTITNAGMANAGTYSVFVSNAVSSVTSSEAVLTVTDPAELRITDLRILEKHFIFRWNAIPSSSYQIQTKTNLFDSNWSVLDTVQPTTSAGAYTNEIGLFYHRFYQLRTVGDEVFGTSH